MAPRKKRAKKQNRKNVDEPERAKKQKRKNVAEPQNVSQSESANLNNMSDSLECSASARKNLTKNCKVISNRRRSTLRSAAKPIQTGIASLSRGHSSAPDDMQQVDDPTETIDYEFQGSEIDSDKKESPSRYLVSFVHPSTLELIPLEQDSLSGEKTNDSPRKCILSGGCSSPSYSSNLSEMVAMMGNEDGDEVDSEIPSRAEDSVNGYRVKMEFMPILRKIIDKHGDIARNCMMESVKCRAALLEIICGVISDFEKKDVSSITESALKNKIAFVDGLRNMKVEVEWLHMTLTDMLEAKEILMQSSSLKEKSTKNRKRVELAEFELEECEAQKKELSEKLKTLCEKEILCKENLAKAKDECATTSLIVGFAKSKVRRYLNCSVVDALI